MDLHLLRLALSHFIGQELTPEVASRIEFITCGGVDLSRDPAEFEPQISGDYVIRVERLRDVQGEMHRLHEAYWHEVGDAHLHGLPMRPDYSGMDFLERSGRLVQFTVRTAPGELVGQCRMYLATSMHTGTLMADDDTLFLMPAHRGTFLVMTLLRYAEMVLVQRFGVREIYANSRLANNVGVLMRRLGYRAVSERYVKVFPAPAARMEAEHGQVKSA